MESQIKVSLLKMMCHLKSSIILSSINEFYNYEPNKSFSEIQPRR